MVKKAISHNARYQMLNQAQIERISAMELADGLRKKINDGFEHIYNDEVHISEEDRIRWNSMTKVNLDSSEGLMTPEEKAKLNTLEKGANRYIHPTQEGFVPNKYYMQVITNRDGHVVKASNPNRLEGVSATSSTLLGGYTTDRYIKANNPELTFAPAINTISNTSDKLQPVNVEYMKNNSLSEAYVISDEENTDRSKIRISTDFKRLSYYDDKSKSWKELNSEADFVELDEYGRIPDKYLYTNELVPIGGLIQVHPTSYDKLFSSGNYKPLGSVLNISDYPELTEFIFSNGNYIDDKSKIEALIGTTPGILGYFIINTESGTIRIPGPDPNIMDVELRHYKRYKQSNLVPDKKTFIGQTLMACIPESNTNLTYDENELYALKVDPYKNSSAVIIPNHTMPFLENTKFDKDTDNRYILEYQYNYKNLKKHFHGAYQLYFDPDLENKEDKFNNKDFKRFINSNTLDEIFDSPKLFTSVPQIDISKFGTDEFEEPYMRDVFYRRSDNGSFNYIDYDLKGSQTVSNIAADKPTEELEEEVNIKIDGPEELREYFISDNERHSRQVTSIFSNWDKEIEKGHMSMMFMMRVK